MSTTITNELTWSRNGNRKECRDSRDELVGWVESLHGWWVAFVPSRNGGMTELPADDETDAKRLVEQYAGRARREERP